ncbi:amidohydrolase family protein [Rhodanobacter sp. L36]|uniref:amidohydrolase family protein n=1 Tax=Rhodanobacter sp. L36 TaxID=1747221 RepID=UPI00131D261A|nr:amidohydrolase family protein [Rhodanobacter sp. L36]
MRVDFHTHIMPPPSRIPDWAATFGPNRWPKLVPQDDTSAMLMMGQASVMKLDDRFWSPERRLVDMDRLGVDMQVLSPIPMLSCYWAPPAGGQAVARHLNEYIAEVVAGHPARFTGMGTVPLHDADLAIAELRLLKDTLKIHAVQIGTCPANRDLDDPFLFPFFEACRDMDMSVFVHPMQPLIGGERLDSYYLPNIVGNPLETALAMTRFIVGGVMERLPDLRICFAHGGGAFSHVLGRVDKGFAVRSEMHEHIERPPSDYARMIYVDAMTFDPSSLRLVVEKHGADRVLMGSDYPFLLGDSDPVAGVQAANLPDDVTRAILEENVWKFMSDGR